MRISRIADLGRQLPAAKAVDVDLPAVRPREGPARQSVHWTAQSGSSRQRVQVFALDHDGAGVAPASTLTEGNSSVTTTLCCSTTMAIEMSTCFTCPAASTWLVK